MYPNKTSTERTTMGFLGGQSNQERYYNRPIGEVFAALTAAAQTPGFSLNKADDISMSVTFSTGVSMTTWGETVTASCHPTGDGTTVQVGATGKAMSTIWQSGRNARVTDKFFNEVTAQLA